MFQKTNSFFHRTLHSLKLTKAEQKHEQEKKTEACSSRSPRDCNRMEKKIKKMYVTETGDIEKALDVEEALYYYSRLRSQVYLNIVGKFFNDLYA
ncbi:unnamed protein product [Brassica oleracea var. botrytis]|uniref:BnaC01g44230D protein n=2 Tax=Brassica napus TaxID=3708 RepID=A0A078IKT7_BRANA|nr:hypothetical protein HID58_043976 [Brassica napus]CAF2078481.1 unnamed protein product [Brassica napus]CDY50621.1 BnaC01g44230D [Brassica napus]